MEKIKVCHDCSWSSETFWATKCPDCGNPCLFTEDIVEPTFISKGSSPVQSDLEMSPLELLAGVLGGERDVRDYQNRKARYLNPYEWDEINNPTKVEL